LNENADILRALGRFLDEQQATTFEVINHVSFLAVSWDSANAGASQRSYLERQLGDLREEARTFRQGDAPVGSLVELLRTIGQELDNADVELSGIIREPTTFQVSGVAAGRHYHTTYRTKDLVAIAAARRERRGKPGLDGTVSSAPPADDSFVGVEVGAEVFTEKRELLGEVVEIRGRYFRVGRDFLGREYWLPAESVASIGARGEVNLWPLDR